jgi:hypothetical protein
VMVSKVTIIKVYFISIGDIESNRLHGSRSAHISTRAHRSNKQEVREQDM